MVESKKTKRNLDVSEEDKDHDSLVKKQKFFCAKTFRRELNSNDRLKSLQVFSDIAHNKTQDVALEYFDAGGSVHELLSLLDVTATKDLTAALPVFRAVHYVIVKSQAEGFKYHKETEDGIKYLLDTFMSTILSMINFNNSKYRKVVLKLLTSIVSFNQLFGREILSLIKFTPAMIDELVMPSTGKDSLRKSFIFFVLSFLIDGNTIAIQAVLEIKGLISSIIPGLKYDEASIVNVVLTLLKEKILENPNIQKTTKLNVFNTKILQSLFDLYDWKGPRNIKANIEGKKMKHWKEVEVFPEDRKLVMESLHSFLVVLCTSKKSGIIFVDKTIGTSNTNYNQLLSTVLESLETFWENEEITRIVIKILVSCPDLIKPVLIKMETLFQPRESLNWLKAVSFVENLLTSLKASSLLEIIDVGIQQQINIIRSLAIPLSVAKNLSVGVEKSQSITVRYHSMRLLILMWDKCQEFLSHFKENQVQLKKSLVHSLSNFLPNFDDLINLWHEICCGKIEETPSALPKIKKESILLVIINAIKTIFECGQDGVESVGLLANEMMTNLENLPDLNPTELGNIQIKILQLVTLADPTYLTHESELFTKALDVLFKIKNEVSLNTLSLILINSGIFENNEAEIDVWLDCFFSLPEENREGVSKSLIKCICQAFNKPTEIQQIQALTDVSEKENIFLDLMERDLGNSEKYSKVTLEILTPMLKNCLENIESLKKKKIFLSYLSEVIVNLLHFYSDKNGIINICDDFKEHLSDELEDYLNSWKEKNLLDVNFEIFNNLDSLLVGWLVEDDESDSVSEILEGNNLNLVKKFLLFRTVISYLSQLAENDLNEIKANKFLDCLSYLLNMKEPEILDSYSNVLSLNVNNENLYHQKCVNSILNDQTLLRLFNIFEKKDSLKNFNDVLVKLLSKEINFIRKMPNDAVVAQWKMKFLRQLKSRAKKRKKIEIPNFEEVLNFFEYDFDDCTEVLKELMSIEDLDFFIESEVLSKWSIVLAKFVGLHCSLSDDNEKVVKFLCNLVLHFEKNDDVDLSLLDKCLVDVLRKKPINLMLIENDFMQSILLRSNINDSTIELGKLLLNDPGKVNHFLKSAIDHSENLKNYKAILPMLSFLLITDDKFLELSPNLVWDVKKVFNDKNDAMQQILKSTYTNIKSDILKAINKKQPSYIIENVSIVSLLIKRFSNLDFLIKVRKRILKEKSFHPELCFSALIKLNQSEVAKTFLEGLMKDLSKKLKNGEEDDWAKYCDIVNELKKKFKENKWSSLLTSPAWKDFYFYALKISLDSSTSSSSSLLKLLRSFIEAIFKEKSSCESIQKIFEMLISHSEFLKVILSSSPSKTELVQLYLSLIERDKSLMATKHIPVILASYSASLNLSDQILLKIFISYENNGIDVIKHQPYFWGEAAVNHYSLRPTSSVSLMRQMNITSVLDLLDLKRVKATLTDFPIERSIDLSKTNENINQDVYDPAFYLPLFANLLAPGASINCQAFIYKGALALTIRSLSSKCEKIRLAASLVLARFYSNLELVQYMKQKLTWVHFIDCIRYGTEDLSEKPFSNIVALFLARATLEISEPLGNMYTPLTNFILAKPVFDLNSLPEFLVLFHSSDVHFQKHRQWILEILRDGTKQGQEVGTILAARSLKLILSFYQTHLCSRELKILILEILTSIVKANPVSLLSEHGLLSWLNHICLNPDKNLLEPIIKLCLSIMEFFKKLNKKDKFQPFLSEFFNVTMKLTGKFEKKNQRPIFLIYLTILLDCLQIFSQEKFGVKLPKTKLDELVETGNLILGESSVNHMGINFYFRKTQEDDTEILRKVIFIYQKLIK